MAGDGRSVHVRVRRQRGAMLVHFLSAVKWDQRPWPVMHCLARRPSRYMHGLGLLLVLTLVCLAVRLRRVGRWLIMPIVVFWLRLVRHIDVLWCFVPRSFRGQRWQPWDKWLRDRRPLRRGAAHRPGWRLRELVKPLFFITSVSTTIAAGECCGRLLSLSPTTHPDGRGKGRAAGGDATRLGAQLFAVRPVVHKHHLLPANDAGAAAGRGGHGAEGGAALGAVHLVVLVRDLAKVPSVQMQRVDIAGLHDAGAVTSQCMHDRL